MDSVGLGLVSIAAFTLLTPTEEHIFSFFFFLPTFLRFLKSAHCDVTESSCKYPTPALLVTKTLPPKVSLLLNMWKVRRQLQEAKIKFRCMLQTKG